MKQYRTAFVSTRLFTSPISRYDAPQGVPTGSIFNTLGELVDYATLTRDVESKCQEMYELGYILQQALPIQSILGINESSSGFTSGVLLVFVTN